MKSIAIDRCFTGFDLCWLVDVKGYGKRTFFFVVIGTNPTTMHFSQRFVDFDGIAVLFLGDLAEHPALSILSILPSDSVPAECLLLRFCTRKGCSRTTEPRRMREELSASFSDRSSEKKAFFPV